jgi:hypothetical protein
MAGARRSCICLVTLVCSLLAGAGRAGQLPDPADGDVVLYHGARRAGGIEITTRANRFGGISGMRGLGKDTLLLLSDRGRLYTAQLQRAPNGALRAATIALVPDATGLAEADAESLAFDGKDWLVSDEATGRLLHIAPTADGLPGAVGEWGPVQPKLAPSITNQAVESLTLLPSGALLAIHEASPNSDGRHPAFIGHEGVWQAAEYSTEAPFVPTDATPLPGGGLAVVERTVSLLRGFQCRVRIVPSAAIKPGARFSGTLVAWFRAGPWADNCEGIHAQPQADGAVELLIVSDNNFSPMQRTILMQLLLPAETVRMLSTGDGS